MSEALLTLFNQIKDDSSFLTVSEAQTSQGIVLPILHNLGWNVFDTNEVTPEYSVGGKRVDFALRIQSLNKVFLEIKKTSENLENHHEQLVYYAFQQGVKQAILTNGITWQFYLPLEEGSWEQRKFFTIDLLEQSANDALEKFESLLSKENIETGGAHQNAKLLYEGRQKSKIIKENLPKAWKKLMSEPDEMLVELLNDTLEKISGYKADETQIIQFLEQTFSGSTFVLDTKKSLKPVAKTKTIEPIADDNSNSEFVTLDLEFISNLSFTKLTKGEFAKISATGWRGLLNIGLKMAFDKGISVEILQRELDANFRAEGFSGNGYSVVPGTDFSLQGQDANDTANNVVRLAKMLNCEVYVLFEWQAKSKFPGKKGLIHWKP